MKIPKLGQVKVEDLRLLYVEGVRGWAAAPGETHHADLISAVADELERRGKPVPTDEVQSELQSLIDRALVGVDMLRKRAGQ